MTIQKAVTRIELERRRRGWTQVDLAFFARLSQAEVSKIETGYARPYPRQAMRLANALGLDPGKLLEEVAAPPETRRK